MNRLIFYLTILVTGLCMQFANAQTDVIVGKTETTKSSKKSDAEYDLEVKQRLLETLKRQKESVEAEEKAVLKHELEKINKALEQGTITAEEAQTRKELAARNAALNIDNKTAILENQRALAERDQNYNIKPDRGGYIALGLGNAYDDQGSMLLGVEYEAPAKVIFDKRTYGDIVVASGISNAFTERSSLKDSPYKWWKSGYTELGYTLRTRLAKESNFFRLAYGLSFQINTLSVGGNQYFTEQPGGQTILEDFAYDLKRQDFRITNLVVPVYLEFGPSTRTDYADKFRYSTLSSIKAGIGGYAGMRIGSMQELTYKVDGSRHRDRLYRDYNASNFVYGLGAYVGYGPLSLYFKYDLNPIFKNAASKQNLFSVALRFDL